MNSERFVFLRPRKWFNLNSVCKIDVFVYKLNEFSLPPYWGRSTSITGMMHTGDLNRPTVCKKSDVGLECPRYKKKWVALLLHQRIQLVFSQFPFGLIIIAVQKNKKFFFFFFPIILKVGNFCPVFHFHKEPAGENELNDFNLLQPLKKSSLLSGVLLRSL